ncbi:hypothetical protein [Nostoc sp.]
MVEKIAKMLPPPGREAAWEKLQARKPDLEPNLNPRHDFSR